MKAPQHGHSEELVERTREWLEREGAKYADGSSFGARAPVDFVVFEPFPLAIECKVYRPVARAKFTAKRLLANRILLAQEFSPSMPIIVITDKFEQASSVKGSPYLDSMLQVDDLPPLQQLRDLQIDPDTYRILQHSISSGEDAPALTEPDEFFDTWSEAMSLRDIYEDRELRPGSIAEEVRILIQESLRQENATQVPWSKVATIRPINSEGVDLLKSLSLNRKFGQHFDEILNRYAQEIIGGGAKRVEFHLGSQQRAKNRFDVLQSAQGQKLMLRRLSISQSTEHHKSKELMADAAILKSFGGLTERDFVLLLGARESWWDESAVEGGSPLSILKMINEFELAGWRVFPWDFNMQTPSFARYLGSWMD